MKSPNNIGIKDVLSLRNKSLPPITVFLCYLLCLNACLEKSACLAAPEIAYSDTDLSPTDMDGYDADTGNKDKKDMLEKADMIDRADLKESCIEPTVLRKFIKELAEYITTQDLSALKTDGSSKVARPGAARCDYIVIDDNNIPGDNIEGISSDIFKKTVSFQELAGYKCGNDSEFMPLVVKEKIPTSIDGVNLNIDARRINENFVVFTDEGRKVIEPSTTFAGENEDFIVVGIETDIEAVNKKTREHFSFQTGKGWILNNGLVCQEVIENIDKPYTIIK